MSRTRRFGLLLVPLALAASAVAALGGTTVFRAHLSGRDEIPARETRASGQAVFNVNTDATVMQYRLIVANIDNVVAAHIHLGSSTETGPVVATLYGPMAPGGGRKSGVLAAGMLAASDLTGDLAGHPLSDLIAAMKAGNAYVNVHTDDGVAPPDERAGDFPAGEIRGQVR